jgi:hypothetical protein
MAKKPGWKKGEGVYSSSDDLNLRQVPHPGWETKDISRTVDSNAKTDAGFSGPLKPARE